MLEDEHVKREATDKWRTIKFRGIAHWHERHTGEWVFGCYNFFDGYDQIMWFEAGRQFFTKVRRETVGEWIGMLDALGIEIFEGDVIKSVESDPVHLICWSEYHASFVAVPVIESTSAF